MKNTLRFLIAAMAFGLQTANGLAATQFTPGAGSVTTVDRLASFDGLVDYDSADLGTYTEAGLYIQTPSSYPSFNMCGNPCWYANAGYDRGPTIEENLVRIGTTDGVAIHAAEFVIDGGLQFAEQRVIWEAYLDGRLVGKGSQQWAGAGSIVGWSDLGGFTELRVGLYDPLNRPAIGAGLVNLIAIDNLKVQLTSSVPEPSGAALMLLGGLLCLWRVRGQKSA